MQKRRWVARLAAALLCLPLWAAAGTPHWVHYRLLNQSVPLPRKVVVIPMGVTVFEVTAGGVKEEVPQWSKEASANVLKAISTAIAKVNNLQEVSMLTLGGRDQAVLDEHMALYKLVVNTANSTGMAHKARRFDYGIGPGLANMLRRTGADVAVMVYGRDYASTAGRKTGAVLGKIPLIGLLAGGDVELGHSFIHVGIVELRTGDLLWMNSKYEDGSSNLRDPDDAQSLVKEIFEWYPGIEQYRKAYVD